jgi:hypothetical protein
MKLGGPPCPPADQPDPIQAAQLISGHIEGKRRALALEAH